MSTPASSNPHGLALVWSGDGPRRIESVTVRRRYYRPTPRGGSEAVDIDVSLPRVRFLEAHADPAAPFPPEIESGVGDGAAAIRRQLAEAA